LRAKNYYVIPVDEGGKGGSQRVEDREREKGLVGPARARRCSGLLSGNLKGTREIRRLGVRLRGVQLETKEGGERRFGGGVGI